MKSASPLARLLGVSLAATLFCSALASAAPPRLKLIPVAENGFSSPVAITNAADGSGRLFVVEQRGTIHIIESDGTVLPEPFLDISAKLVDERGGFDERGLLSVAFHPAFDSAALGGGKFYVYYSAPSPNSPGTDADPVDHMSVVAEYSVSADPDKADAASERILLTFDQPQFNHNGGQLAFRPDSLLLYISTGDGGGADDNDAGHTDGNESKPAGGLGNSQDLTNYLGKILRIDPLGSNGPGGQYGIPASNPFVGGVNGEREEIYAYGLRNPWRFSFDRGGTNQLFCADVGQDDVEEVNIIVSGGNYGWRRFEGGTDFDATAPTTGNVFEAPIGQYAHPNSNIPGLLNIGTSVTGGFVYRGSLIPDLVGTYVFGDWTASFSTPSGTLLALEPDGGGDFDLSLLEIESGNPVNFFVPAFGEDEAGEIYVAGKTTLAPSATDPATGSKTGSIYRLGLAPPLAPLPKVRLEPLAEAAFFSPVAITSANDGTDRLYVVEQRGTIHIIESDGTILPEPFLDISAKLVDERGEFDERGLLSVAFHPDPFPGAGLGSGKFYVYYSAPSPNAPGTDADPVDHMSVVSEFEFSADPDRADATSERILLTFDQPQFNHDGGQVAFGPDGLLYISTGDGGGGDDNDAGHTGGNEGKPDGGLGNSQDLTNFLGKILRIHPFLALNDAPYSIPGGNPFVDGIAGERREIYAYGLRNPWRFSFDRGGTSQLFCADVGQREVEEVNIITSGGNYGWRRFEGGFDFDATAPTTGNVFEAPIAQYGHPNTDLPGIPKIGTSITGGHVYRGTESPGLVGAYLFGDWTNSFVNPAGSLLALTPGASPGSWDLGALDVEGGNPIGMYVPAFGEDSNGEIYVATKTTLAPSAVDPVTGGPTGSVFKIVEITATGGVAGSTTIEPLADTTIFEEIEPLANGADRYLFSGHTASSNDGLERRALLKFDIAAAVPPGATIDAVTASLEMTEAPKPMANPAPSSFGLHRLLADWGEGTSDAQTGMEGKGAPATDGSATWISTSFNLGPNWTTPGGDFEPVASASVTIDTVEQHYNWSSALLVGDVQAWLDSPASNYGWMLFSDSDVDATARQFGARENSIASRRPTLAIDFSTPLTIPTYRELWLEEFFPGGSFPGDFSDDDADSLNALIEYGGGTDPTRADDPGAQLQPALNGDGSVSVSFRRDPRAGDLILSMEMSTDLSNWIGVASSSGGSGTVGVPGVGIVERNVVGEFPIKKVTVTLPPELGELPVVNLRLRIDRDGS